MKVIRIDKNNPNQAEALQSIVPASILKGNSIKIFGAADEEKSYLFGVLVLSMEESVIRIDWLYVKEAYRRLGIASNLLNQVLDVISLLEMNEPVEAFFPNDAAHESLLGFFEAADHFLTVKKPEIGRITPDSRNKSKYFIYLLHRTASAELFFQLPSSMQKRFFSKMRKKNLTHFTDDVMNDDANYISELCVCTVSESNIINAVFVKESYTGEIEISFGYLESARQARTLTAYLAQKINELYPERDLVICAVNDASKKLISGIFKDGILWEDFTVAHWNGLRISEMIDFAEASLNL